MIFEPYVYYNDIFMKKMAIILMTFLIVSACSSTKEVRLANSEKKATRKLAEQVVVKKAVEARRYIIKVNRMYLMGGGFVDMIPTSNFIIVNGESASISLGYIGRQYGGRPISGINMNGETVKYELKSDETKGVYNIDMEVKSNNYKFNLYMTIGSSGSANVSLVNSYIQTVSYSGSLVPIGDRPERNKNSEERL
jgi:hypothetical protein